MMLLSLRREQSAVQTSYSFGSNSWLTKVSANAGNDSQTLLLPSSPQAIGSLTLDTSHSALKAYSFS